ncbi:MAG: DUF2752 domain-containing protein [Blastocatellia bacterium]|nr:DUF2752 domain-containing protein [Blastocatellia bacterium]
MTRLWKRLGTQAGLGLLVTTGVFVLSYLWHPSATPTFILCPFKHMTGYDCPGCGLTRAFCALAKGEWFQAITFHPLSPLMFGLFWVWWSWSLLKVSGRNEWADKLAWPVTRRPFVVAVLTVFLVRWGLHLGLGW